MNTTKGYIFLRNGHYYVRYQHKGRDTRLLLHDEQGRTIKSRAKAQEVADRLMAPIRLKGDAMRLRGMIFHLESIEQQLADIEKREADGKATVSGLWDFFARERYPDIDGKPGGGRALLYYYFSADFIKWCETYGVTLLSEVTPEVVAKYAVRLRKFPASSRNDRARSLRFMFATLAKAGIVTGDNPFAGVELAKEEHNRKKPLSREQVKMLIEAAPNAEWRAFIALGYFTGMRRSDCATLRKTEVDLAHGMIERVPDKLRSRARDLEKITVRVAVGKQLGGYLAAIRRNKRSPYILPTIAELYRAKPREVSQRISDMFAAIGLRNERKNQDGTTVAEYGFHSLRHSYISHAIEAGVPAAVVQSWAGHSTARMTEHYTHISDGVKKEYADSLNL